MTEVEFVKINPTQNMTVLVTSPVAREMQAHVAEKIMAYDNVHAEQVGFLEKPHGPQALARLQMAGGEFCGNAALSLCAYLVWAGKVENADGNTVSVPIEASGKSGVLSPEIKRQGKFFLGKMDMGAPAAIETFQAHIQGARYSLPVVHFAGISHIVVDSSVLQADKDLIALRLIEQMSLFTSADAFGAMFFDTSSCAIEPFVYVKTAGTKVWERGCGSGSAALGAYLASAAGKSVTASVKQPGGIITVEASVNSRKEITNVAIEGKIEIAATGRAFL